MIITGLLYHDLFACKSPSIILTLSITDPGVCATLIFLGPINNLVLALRTWRGFFRRRFAFPSAGGETEPLIVDGCERDSGSSIQGQSFVTRYSVTKGVKYAPSISGWQLRSGSSVQAGSSAV